MPSTLCRCCGLYHDNATNWPYGVTIDCVHALKQTMKATVTSKDGEISRIREEVDMLRADQKEQVNDI